ncbi:MAG: hypothetical protein QW416_08250 [Candidatus Nitrosocaldaceae archaeon]
MSRDEEFNKRIWDRVSKIEDSVLRQFIISILRYELRVRDQERPAFKDEYMRILERLVRDNEKKHTQI